MVSSARRWKEIGMNACLIIYIAIVVILRVRLSMIFVFHLIFHIRNRIVEIVTIVRADLHITKVIVVT